MKRQYIAIDLKSFYASAECVERGLDPLNTNLVVADSSKTEKTICLAVTPSLKAIGVPGRPRLFEVVQIVNRCNQQRKYEAPWRTFKGKSYYADELSNNPALAIDYIIAPPQMARYMEVSTKIYEIYLRYVSPDDVHVYSIDEVFIDVTPYLSIYNCNAHELCIRMIRDVLKETGITATAGIGTNLYLAKVAMDIVAKKMPPDEDGVRIAELDEMSYRRQLWEHIPLTDFWRVGAGTARKLEANHMYTMGDVAEYSEFHEDKLYKLFGVNAELLIDHAWGWEPCTIADIKAYRPQSHSLSQGQVLSCAYSYDKGKIIVREMAELLALDLVEKNVVTDQIGLVIGYDHTGVPERYNGKIVTDHYGRRLPKPVNATLNLGKYTSSSKRIVEGMIRLYADIVDTSLKIRRVNVVANRVIYEQDAPKEEFVQLDLFADVEKMQEQQEREEKADTREKAIQHAMLGIKKKYGKNAILKGTNFQEGATTIERNGQVGGHKA